MSSHDREEIDEAQEALRQVLSGGVKSWAADDIVRSAVRRNPRISVEAAKSAIWALARAGFLDVTWDGEIRRQEATPV